jgi:putative transport protein
MLVMELPGLIAAMFGTIRETISAHTVPSGLAMLGLAVTLGLALGAVRIHGFRLGVSGVLFSALVFGQLGLSLDDRVLEFLRDFALIIFVYAIGLQVGPGFLTSLREEGLRLNLLSIVVVVLGALMTAAVVKVAHLEKVVASGLYAGAFTTTPGLAAGQEELRHAPGIADNSVSRALAITGMAYTVTYPFGVVGPILVIAMLRRILGVRVHDERASLAAAQEQRRPSIGVIEFEVTQQDCIGVPLKEHRVVRESGVVFARLLRNNVQVVPNADTVIQLGDVYRAVGPRTALAKVAKALGRVTIAGLDRAAGDVERMDLVVTRTKVLRKSLRELNLSRRTGVTIVRVNRAGVDLPPRASLKLQFGDRLVAVGPEAGLKTVEAELGNSPDTLNRPQLVPIFLGIVLGVLVGSIPLVIPGMNTRLKIGLAGGPMIAAIVLSQLGNIGSVVWYMPVAANQLFRDFGLAVFLACVGLRAGNHFLDNLSGSAGLILIGWGAAITMLPVFLVGLAARRLLRINFVTLAGWVAGAMTSSPALMFAGELTDSDAPALAYASVAPLGFLTPILCAQLLVVFL